MQKKRFGEIFTQSAKEYIEKKRFSNLNELQKYLGYMFEYDGFIISYDVKGFYILFSKS